MNAFVLVNVLCLFCAGHVYSSPTMISQGCCESSSSVQESYSSSSSSYESYSSSSSSSSGASSINNALYQRAFGLASINDIEAQMYLSCLSQLPSQQITYFDEIFDYYGSQSFVLNDLVTDFYGFNSEITNIYNMLAAQSVFASGANWAQQQAILQQCQSSFTNLISYVAPNSCLYNLIDLINNDINSLPLVAGSLYYLSNLQNKYYTQTSSSTVSTSSMTSSTSSSVSSSTAANLANSALYQRAFAAASINDIEAQMYLNALSQMSSNQITYFDQLFDYYNSQTYSLNDVVIDFNGFNTEITNIYNTLSTQSVFASGANWAQQQAIFQQCQSSFSNLISYVAPNSCLYNLIDLINNDINSLPLVAGSLYYLSNLQNQYYTQTSSSTVSTSSVTSSTSSSVSSSTAANLANSALYQRAFAAASINDIEAQMYLNALSQMSSNQITYFDQLFDYYNSQTYSLNDVVIDFNGFNTEITNIYNTLSTQSVFASGANWAQQQAIFQQCQSSFSNLISYVAPNSCLYNLIDLINNDINSLPLVAGSLYYLSNLQNQYYTQTSSSTVSTSSVTSSSSSSVASSCTAANLANSALYQRAFAAASINDIEAQLYMNALSQLSSNQITYFDQLFDYYGSQTYSLNDVVIDFNGFNTEITNIYNTLSTASVFASGANWAQQQAIFQQCQSSFSNLISYIAPNSCLYNLIDLINNDINAIPLVAGCCYHLAAMQGQYYQASSSSSSSSYSSSSSCQQASYQAESSSSSAVLAC